MKRNKGIKRMVLLLFVIVLSFSMVACGSSYETTSEAQNQSQTTNQPISSNQSENDALNVNSSSENDDSSSGPKTHAEYVRTYFVYAEEGAVVTWYDPQTGQFRYKNKCETCGRIGGGEHGGSLYVSGGGKHNSGFTCTNANCSMWGKYQRAIIACSESGEWVEVYD